MCPFPFVMLHEILLARGIKALALQIEKAIEQDNSKEILRLAQQVGRVAAELYMQRNILCFVRDLDRKESTDGNKS